LRDAAGFELTERPEEADVILFNTCSVREKAQERVFHDLGRVRGLNAANPDLIIGVGGCVASQEGAAIVRRAPYVDVVFGPQTLHRLPDLLGQNVNAYRGRMGQDASISSEIADLATLLEYLAEIPRLERIRFTTSHPKEMTRRLIDAYGRIPKLVSQLHLPVQSGSDRVLAAMKRGYTVLEYKSIVRRLRSIRPQLSLSSDFIVAFPGESDADFAQTMQLVDEVGFDG